jgi:hypothetical protein
MRGMSSTQLQEVDRLVLQAIIASPNRTLHGLTKLLKLLFIAAHPQDFDLKVKRPIRSLEFQVYRHGPFWQGVNASLDRLENANLVQRSTKALIQLEPELNDPNFQEEGSMARNLYIFTATPGAEEELVGADEHDLALVREATKKWGWLTPNQIEAFVNRREGLTPALKADFLTAAWDDFIRRAGTRRLLGAPEPSPAFWRCEQVFRRELPSLRHQFSEGTYIAYIDGKRFGAGADETILFNEVRQTTGRAPDFIGCASESGLPPAATMTAL